MDEDIEPWFPLRTARLLLREFRADDFDDVHAYARDPLVARFMEWGPNAEAETREFMARMLAEQETWPREGVNLAIEHAGDHKVIGSIRLSVTDAKNQTGDIGYSLNSGYWRRGLCTEAARALLAVGFGTLGLHRIWAECDLENAGSYRVMEKLGMRREGHIRQGKLIKGQWRDRFVYAILADDFREVRR